MKDAGNSSRTLDTDIIYCCVSLGTVVSAHLIQKTITEILIGLITKYDKDLNEVKLRIHHIKHVSPMITFSKALEMASLGVSHLNAVISRQLLVVLSFTLASL